MDQGHPYPFSEQITVADAFAMFGRRPPDTSTVPSATDGSLPFGGFAALLAGLVGGGVAFRRATTQSRPTRRLQHNRAAKN
jgi:hypothetical protein